MAELSTKERLQNKARQAAQNANQGTGNAEDVVVEEHVDLTSDKIGNYVVDNASKVFTAIGIIIALFLGYFYYQANILAPIEEEALNEMFKAEMLFKQDNFKEAVEGSADFMGFVEVADEYSSTKAGNISNYYAGISYLQLGDYDNAIEYLSNYKSEDLFTETIALSALGDAYAESDNTDKAISYYKKAANNKANVFLTPMYLMKAARALDLQESYSEALTLYKKIQSEYPLSNEGRDIEKFIFRDEARLK